MNKWTLNLHVQKMKTRTSCGELLWRSNMRSCRFEDGSAYFPTGGKSYFRQPNKKYFYVAVALLFLWTKLLPFHERVVRRKISISSCCTNCWEKIIANMQKDRGRQGQGWRKTNVLWEIGYYTCSLPPSLAWTEGPWTLPANYNWNLPSPTHSLHRMAGPKGWKLQHVNTETKTDLISI